MTNVFEKPAVLSEALISEIDHWMVKYPSDKKQSAIIPALLIAQRHHQGWLPEAVINAVADYIEIPRMLAYEVATFYSMLELKPVGEHKISVCTNVSCLLNGCEKIVEHIQKRLKITFGETTQDKRFTLKEVECLGACTQAPVILVDDNYHEGMTVAAVNALLDELEYPS